LTLSKLSNQDKREDLLPTSSNRTTAFSVVDVTNAYEASIEFKPELTELTDIIMSLKPTKPVMGDLIQVSTTKRTAWTGGLPNSDWRTGLDSSVQTYGSPNQLHPNSASYAQRGFQYQSTGLTEKFQRSDDLATFIGEVQEHMVDCGIDTITYLPSPTDPKTMCSVLSKFSKYTATDTVRTAGATLAAMYDSHNKINDKAARKFVLQCLNKELPKTFHLRLEPNNTFHVLWLELINAIRSTNIDCFDDLKAKLKL
jgi:hypothetical protein